jgi:hypothetical protein
VQSVGEPVPEEPFDPLVGERAQVEYRLPQRARVFGRCQARNCASEETENPAVEFIGQALDLLLPRIVDLRDGA